MTLWYDSVMVLVVWWWLSLSNRCGTYLTTFVRNACWLSEDDQSMSLECVMHAPLDALCFHALCYLDLNTRPLHDYGSKCLTWLLPHTFVGFSHKLNCRNILLVLEYQMSERLREN